MSSFCLPAGTEMTSELEDDVLRFECRHWLIARDDALRILIVGSTTNVRELKEHWNACGVIALVNGTVTS